MAGKANRNQPGAMLRAVAFLYHFARDDAPCCCFLVSICLGRCSVLLLSCILLPGAMLRAAAFLYPFAA